ncbi:pyridoxal phosphate-dependent aminotransferase [Paenactinomyces guangxiensis]|uniref:Aminotransferase n=1 Tax=Paenactinomyces guangxiensis TaxID=1490290 RepID=A0A7W2A8Z2_9BACL|nr:pyridoxal phosphate-dependent aminotransferase [Paenactinomyces guangxiensis]MBA4495140.1 pyridoxal phosphate-dependent aminotransferase [Paenactinomyces guangxiensis]MBH8592176.1 pyridoxal phosphate-dependent aminotransferase [Paenactinomyces guangxiensis]
MKLSKRVQQLSPSPTLAITAKAKALRQKGQDVIGLGAGEPDFNTPEHILHAAREAMDEGHTKYTASGGIPELKQAIIQKLERDNGLSYQPGQIIVTVGAKHGLYNLFQVLLDEGDEVIIPAPYWVSYIEQVKLAGGVPVVIDGKEEQQFKITPAQLKDAITERTKAILINSPSNPTGMLYNREELRALGEICIQKDLLIISDEIYEHLIYGGEEHVSIASLGPEFYKRTVVINGVSKTYSMTGWRIGFAAGPAEIIKAMTDLSSHSTSNPTSVAQYAAIAALTGTQEPVGKMKEAFKKRRDYVIKRVNAIPGFHCQIPPGAFYAFVNIRGALNGKYKTPDEWAEALLEKELVAVVPGSGFGSNDHIRISYATSMEQLEKALDRIERFVKQS